MAKIVTWVEYDQTIHRSDSHTQYVDYMERKESKKQQQEIQTSEKEWQEFCENILTEGNQTLSFSKYLDYLQRHREEDLKRLKKSKVLATDNGYKTLSGNEGMFDTYRDVITPKQRGFYHHHFHEAYKQNAILWKPIISFEQGFLEEVNILNNGIVNEEKLKKVTRQAVNNFISNNELPPMHWTGMIHYDTDNIHIHVAMVEKEPTDVSGWSQKEVKEFARCSVSSFQAIKRDISTNLLDRSKQKRELTEHIRQNIIQPSRDLDVVKDFPSQSQALVNKLSAYQYGKLKPYEKAWVNALTIQVLQTKFHDEFQEFKHLVKKENDFYQDLYGKPKHERSDYATNLERDVYYRVGNAILKQLQVEKLRKKDEYNHLSSSIKENKIPLESYQAVKGTQRSELLCAIYRMAHTNKRLRKDLEKASQKAKSQYNQLSALIEFQNQLQEREQTHGYSISI